jgi:hypothetical protein
MLNVTTETINKLASNMRKRVNACTVEHDRHFQHLLQDSKYNFDCRMKILHILGDILIFN